MKALIVEKNNSIEIEEYLKKKFNVTEINFLKDINKKLDSNLNNILNELDNVKEIVSDIYVVAKNYDFLVISGDNRITTQLYCKKMLLGAINNENFFHMLMPYYKNNEVNGGKILDTLLFY